MGEAREFVVGYAIGFDIVRSFKRNNPEIADERLLDLDPEQILRLGKYG